LVVCGRFYHDFPYAGRLQFLKELLIRRVRHARNPIHFGDGEIDGFSVALVVSVRVNAGQEVEFLSTGEEFDSFLLPLSYCVGGFGSAIRSSYSAVASEIDLDLRIERKDGRGGRCGDNGDGEPSAHRVGQD
jgi:hypothetical protein